MEWDELVLDVTHTHLDISERRRNGAGKPPGGARFQLNYKMTRCRDATHLGVCMSATLTLCVFWKRAASLSDEMIKRVSRWVGGCQRDQKSERKVPHSMRLLKCSNQQNPAV